jgi:hypothetical protein
VDAKVSGWDELWAAWSDPDRAASAATAPQFKHAASLTRNARERKLLLERAAACARGAAPQ